jgi:hypothetical protein
MPSKRPFRVTRDVPGGINPGSFGRKGARGGQSPAGWAERMDGKGLDWFKIAKLEKELVKQFRQEAHRSL